MMNDALIAILARRALGELQAQDMVDWAVQEIVAGRDTPEVCVLAGMSAPFYSSEINAQFAKVLDERGVVPPDDSTLIRLYARQIAQALLDCSIDSLVACDLLRHIDSKILDGEYAVWFQLYWALQDVSDGYEQHYYPAVNFTPADFDDYARMEARRFLSEL